MSAKNAKKLRKKLGMTKENMKNKEELKEINTVKKIVYFKNSFGETVPALAERSQVINPNLNYYRKMKKELKKDK